MGTRQALRCFVTDLPSRRGAAGVTDDPTAAGLVCFDLKHNELIEQKVTGVTGFFSLYEFRGA